MQALVYDFLTHQPRYLARLPHRIYAGPIRTDLLHRCVRWQRNAMRQGTHATKNRSQVRGSTRKIRPQKKMGRARAGSIRSPIFRKGGIAHGPVPRTHYTDLQAKVRELGLISAIAAKFRANQLAFTMGIELPSWKTRDVVGIFNRDYKAVTREGLGVASRQKHRAYSSVLVVAGIDLPDPRLSLATRNLPNVLVLPATSLNVYDILRHEHLVLDHDARVWLEWRLSLDR